MFQTSIVPNDCNIIWTKHKNHSHTISKFLNTHFWNFLTFEELQLYRKVGSSIPPRVAPRKHMFSTDFIDNETQKGCRWENFFIQNEFFSLKQ